MRGHDWTGMGLMCLMAGRKGFLFFEGLVSDTWFICYLSVRKYVFLPSRATNTLWSAQNMFSIASKHMGILGHIFFCLVMFMVFKDEDMSATCLHWHWSSFTGLTGKYFEVWLDTHLLKSWTKRVFSSFFFFLHVVPLNYLHLPLFFSAVRSPIRTD